MSIYIILEKKALQMKYEIKKMCAGKYNKIIWSILLIATIFLGIMPARTVSIQEDINGSNMVKGRKAIQLEQERYKNSEGELTLEKISSFIGKIKEFPNDDAAYSTLSFEEPGMLKILSYAYSTPDGSFMAAAKKTNGKDFYEKNQDQINDLIKNNKDNYRDEEKQIIIEKANSLKTPYYLTYAKQWSLLHKSFSLLYMIIALSLIIQTSSVFSYEKEICMDRILVSSVRKRGQIVNNKIKAVVSFIAIQWLISSIILIAIFGFNFGFSGFFSQIQIEYFTSIYNLTFGKTLIMEIFLGFVTLISISLLTMVINYFNKNTFKTLLISIAIVFIPLIVLRFPGLSNSLRRFIETLPIFGGNIYKNLLTLNIYNIFNISVLRTSKIFFNTVVLIVLELLVMKLKTQFIRRTK